MLVVHSSVLNPGKAADNNAEVWWVVSSFKSLLNMTHSYLNSSGMEYILEKKTTDLPLISKLNEC